MSQVITATGQAPLNVTQYGIFVGAGTGQSTANSVINLTNGQILVGVTGAAPNAATFSNGTGISVGYSTGVLTITNTAPGMATIHETGSSVTLAAANQYVMDKSTLITATLPTTAAIGDTFSIIGCGAGLWVVDVASGQTIQVGATASTASTGSIAATNQFDCVDIVCVTANTLFVCKGMQGQLTVV